MQKMYEVLTFRGPSFGFGDGCACSRFLTTSSVLLRDPRRGGNRCGLDGRQPVLDRRRTQKNHQRGSSGKGLTDPQNSHRGKNDSPPSHRGGSSKRVGSGPNGGCKSLCCCAWVRDTMMDDPLRCLIALQLSPNSPLQRRFFYFYLMPHTLPHVGGGCRLH